MTDYYGLCKAALIARLRTLTTYFPASAKHVTAGWQVSDDDAVLSEGGDYFLIIRPGAFPTRKQGRMLEVEWHADAVLYVRYKEQLTSWTRFETIRSDIFNLLHADPSLNRTNGVYDVGVSSQEKAGRLVDAQGNLMNWIAQTLDVTINQRINMVRA